MKNRRGTGAGSREKTNVTMKCLRLLKSTGIRCGHSLTCILFLHISNDIDNIVGTNGLCIITIGRLQCVVMALICFCFQLRQLRYFAHVDIGWMAFIYTFSSLISIYSQPPFTNIHQSSWR